MAKIIQLADSDGEVYPKVYSPDIEIRNLKGCQTINTGNGTGTYTITGLETNEIYLLILGKQNATTASYSGMYIVSIHNSSHVRTVVDASHATVSVSGGTLTVTTTQKYYKIILIRIN